MKNPNRRIIDPSNPRQSRRLIPHRINANRRRIRLRRNPTRQIQNHSHDRRRNAHNQKPERKPHIPNRKQADHDLTGPNSRWTGVVPQVGAQAERSKPTRNCGPAGDTCGKPPSSGPAALIDAERRPRRVTLDTRRYAGAAPMLQTVSALSPPCRLPGRAPRLPGREPTPSLLPYCERENSARVVACPATTPPPTDPPRPRPGDSASPRGRRPAPIRIAKPRRSRWPGAAGRTRPIARRRFAEPPAAGSPSRSGPLPTAPAGRSPSRCGPLPRAPVDDSPTRGGPASPTRGRPASRAAADRHRSSPDGFPDRTGGRRARERLA